MVSCGNEKTASLNVSVESNIKMAMGLTQHFGRKKRKKEKTRNKFIRYKSN